MKHILAVIPSLGLGGAEKALVVWVAALQKLGYRITVVTTQADEDFFLLPAGMGRFRRQRVRKRVSSGIGRVFGLLFRLIEPFVNAYYLRRVIRRTKADVVIAHLPKSAIPALLASERERVPCFVMEHSYQERLQDPVLNSLRPVIYPWARGLVVLTPDTEELFRSLNRCLVQIKNPIEIPQEVPPFSAKEKVILLAGRLAREKQFAEFVKRSKGLDWQDWQVWIAGEGAERAALEAVIVCEGLVDKVRLLGAVSDMSSLYRRAGLFVLCSNREGFSVVLAEAALYGCVRVSFACPSGPETMIDSGRTGYLVADQDWQALFARLEELMSDSALREEMYHASLVPQVAFDPEYVAKQWQTLIEGA